MDNDFYIKIKASDFVLIQSKKEFDRRVIAELETKNSGLLKLNSELREAYAKLETENDKLKHREEAF